MPVDLAGPLVDVHLQVARLAELVEDEVGDLGDGDVDAGRDVDHLAGDASIGAAMIASIASASSST